MEINTHTHAPTLSIHQQIARRKQSMTVKEVAEVLNVSEGTIRKLIKTGEIASAKVTDRVLMDPKDVARYWKSVKVTTRRQ